MKPCLCSWYCTPEDLIEFSRLGERRYFARRLRKYLDSIGHTESPSEVYYRMMQDPLKFYNDHLEYFRMPINMLITYLTEFKNIL